MFCLFNKKSLGIDISDQRIWVTRLIKSGRFFLIDTLKGAKLESGIVENGRIKNKEELAKIVNSLMGELKAESSCEKRIIFGLPKNQVFVHLFSDTTGNTDKKYIEKAVEKDTEESIPLETSDLYYNYKVLEKNSEQTNILVIAVSRELIYEWQDFFSSLNINVQIYDLNSLATFRNLYRKMPKSPICILDIGGDSTSITVFNKRGLRYSHSLRTAGEDFTQKIASTLNVSLEEAEKLKLENGLKNNKEIFNILNNELQIITNTIQDIFNYLKEKTNEEVEKIVLVGGSALMDGLPVYFQKKLNRPVEIGRPLVTSKENSFSYLNSIGLALRGFERRSKQKDLGLLPIEKNKKQSKLEKKKNNKDKEEEQVLSDFSEEEVEQNKEVDKIKRQKIVLLLILLLGTILLGLAFWYRSSEVNKKQIIGGVDKNLFPYENTIVLQIPIATDKSELTKDRVEGRIVESMDPNLKSTEKLWPTPISLNPNRWLVYRGDTVELLIFAKIKEKIGNIFSLGQVDYETMTRTDNPNLLLLKTVIIFYSSEDIQVEEKFDTLNQKVVEEPLVASSSEKLEIINEKKLKIDKTPTGWLNARDGAGLNYAIIDRVNSDDEFVYVNEANNWYEIILDKDVTGWISSEYAILLN